MENQTPDNPSQEQRKSSDPRLANLKPFKPGQSGNPGGRPKGTSLTKLVREALAKSEFKSREKDGKVITKTLPDGMTVADLLADVIVREALKGDFRFAKEVWDRQDGKVPDKSVADVNHHNAGNLLAALKAKTADEPDERKRLAGLLDELSRERTADDVDESP